MDNFKKGIFNFKRKIDSWISNKLKDKDKPNDLNINKVTESDLHKNCNDTIIPIVKDEKVKENDIPIKKRGWEKKLTPIQRKRFLWIKIGNRTKSKRIRLKQIKLISNSYLKANKLHD